MQRESRPHCSFFARGRCRNGDACRFSHEFVPAVGGPNAGAASGGGANGGAVYGMGTGMGVAAGASVNGGRSMAGGGVPVDAAAAVAPPPAQVRLPPMTPIFAIDVECVATGVQHHDRAVAQISLVDGNCMVHLNLYVRPAQPVRSYLTPLTGLTAEVLDTHGMPLERALATLRAHLPPNGVLVGLNIAKDVEWLGLSEGRDFASMIDLAALLRAWNPRFGSFTYSSQDHYAKVWLGFQRTEQDAHDAVTDAIISMRLFHAFTSVQHDAGVVAAIGDRVLAAPATPSFAKRNPTFEGCCMGNRKLCKCGAPFFS